MRGALAAFLVLAAFAALAGCGSGGSSTDSAAAKKAIAAKAAKRQEEAARRIAAETKALEAAAPPGASPVLKGLYRAFQPPETESMTPASAKAVKAGEAACKGKTPAEVKEQYFGAAEEFLEAEQAKIIEQIGHYEEQETTDQSFVAGQLAADTYAATLPTEGEEEQAGYQGCIYALATQLERKLSATMSRNRGK